MRQAYVEDGKLVVRDEGERDPGYGGDGRFEISLSINPERVSDSFHTPSRADNWSSVVLLELMGDVRTLLLWK